MKMYLKLFRTLLGILFLTSSFCSAQKSTSKTESKTLLPAKCGRPAADDKITNGSPAPIGAYPWMAGLGYTKPGSSKLSFECAGAIINSKYVLTAAHCVDPDELGAKSLSVIHLGDYDLTTENDCQKTPLGQRCSTPHIVAGVEDTVLHPKYNTRGKSSDDVALIRLNLTLDFESSLATIEPVCLPPDDFNLTAFAGNIAPVAAGWGLTEKGINSNILLRVSVPIAGDALCKKRYKENFVGNQLCIGGGEEGFDTCSGDSGGPLVMTAQRGPPFYQVGIVSFGPFPCGINQFPGVYANVADYKNWIINNMRP